jgi:general secretion pathway protein D
MLRGSRFLRLRRRLRRDSPKAIVLLALTLTVTACATTRALRDGQRAEFLQEYDRAIVEYTKVLREDPDNRDARQGLERTKVRSSLDHFSRGRRFSQTGRLQEALIELQIAAELNPSSADIEELLRSVRTQVRNKITVSREDKTELESLIERMRSMPPPGLDLPDAQMPESLMWSGSARDLYSFLGKTANISVAFDPQFKDQTINIDLRNQSLADALGAVSRSTQNFYQVTGQRTVLIIPDTPAKRQQYEEEIVRVFPLSNADLKETSDLLRIVIDNRRLSFLTANNTIAIKDTPARVMAAGRLIAAIDKARPEIVIDVEILEVDRTSLLEYGLQIASPAEVPTGINGQVTIEDQTLAELRMLSQSGVFLTNLPGLFYRLLKQDSNTRTLANTQIRLSDGQPGQARFGERVPIPVTVFSPIATGGVAQQPITSFNYQDIGVNIDITPRTHHDDDVTLALKLEVSAITGAGFGGLPTIGSRAISTVNRLRDGETNLLAGLIRDEDRRTKAGVPGLSDIPAIGSLFAHNRRETHETDVVITLTPRIIRMLDITEADLRAFQVGDSAGGGLDIVLPIPGAVQPADPAQPPPQQQTPQQPFQPGPVQPTQPAQPGPAAPIFPPNQPPPAPTPPPGK